MDRLDFQQNSNTVVPIPTATSVEEYAPIACPPTPQDTLAIHEEFLLLPIAKSPGIDSDDQSTQLPDDNFSLLFAPSQPLASSKFSELGFPTPEIPNLTSTTVPSFDIEDENVFMPLSFQEFGY